MNKGLFIKQLTKTLAALGNSQVEILDTSDYNNSIKFAVISDYFSDKDKHDSVKEVLSSLEKGLGDAFYDTMCRFKVYSKVEWENFKKELM